MATVQIISVSEAAAKRAFKKLTSSNNVVVTSATNANGPFLDIQILPENHLSIQCEHEWREADKKVIELNSNYFYTQSLIEMAQKVAGHGTVKELAQ